MSEWNLNQKDHLGPRSPPGRFPRMAFCPTCGRPFLRGSGVRQGGKGSPGIDPSKDVGEDPENPEYCGEKCLPGLPA